MTQSSRIPGFYKLSVEERRKHISEVSSVEHQELFDALAVGGLTTAMADKVVENVLGIYALPFGIALNVQVNGRDRLVPMVVEEPSVIAAASNASRMIRRGGGFSAEMQDTLMTGQIQVYNVPDTTRALARLEQAREELLELARLATPSLEARGGGPREVEVRDLGEGCLVVHIHIDCCDAMGANLVNHVAESLGPRVRDLAGGKLGLRILSNLCDRRRVRVTCRVPLAELRLRGDRGSSYFPPPLEPADSDDIIDVIVQASRFAELDPYRAVTHNKGIMNGVDAVVLATGNDFRAVEAGAHAYAARSGRYAPLATWRRDGSELVGALEMPLALGIVGGTLRVHPAAQLALRIMRVESASDLSLVAASVGLASNLAALRALATEGIQRGHMSLHARSVAAAAGARGDEVEQVALALSDLGVITLAAAQKCLQELRHPE
ncbi:MAG: hydroxymethylglutaryl-CoA reductase, degradative [Polyangiaceae bacterium]|nr:hydroxymethylglutaryl-CoA reductase, degradative [Polyangiaceae bacterium]